MSEIYISVDIEADGPIPGPYSMLSLGAAIVNHADDVFYMELKPISDDFVQGAMDVNGLDREKLIKDGLSPEVGMQKFADWVVTMEKKHNGRAVFLAAPAVWDGMYVHWYFMRFINYNPFGRTGSGIDLRTYWMGMNHVAWGKTGKRAIKKALNFSPGPHTHRADDDAKEQAEYFSRILSENCKRKACLKAALGTIAKILGVEDKLQKLL